MWARYCTKGILLIGLVAAVTTDNFAVALGGAGLMAVAAYLLNRQPRIKED